MYKLPWDRAGITQTATTKQLSEQNVLVPKNWDIAKSLTTFKNIF